MPETIASINKQIAALKARADRLARKRKPAMQTIMKLARTHGISADEIRTALNGRTAPTTRTPKRAAPKRVARKVRKSRAPLAPKTGQTWSGRVPPKYRDPKTGQTWSGRGRVAGWLAAAEKQGHKRAEFLLN